jgi:methylenetetrahydrofolate reductase (NADPH)
VTEQKIMSTPDPCPASLAQAEAVPAPAPAASACAELMADSSIELTTNGRAVIEQAVQHLAPGTRVYIPKLPQQTLSEKLMQISILREFGQEPVPHIVARQLNSRQELRDFLNTAAREAGVKRVLVIGGDLQQEAGPFSNSAEVIASGLIQEAGIAKVDVAGYPDGHPHIPQETLWADLGRKQRLAREQALSLGIVTQFSFAPAAIAHYCSEVALRAPGIKVFAGIPGPTSTRQLMRFAKICGVSTSIKAFNRLGLNAVKLALHSSPDQQLEVLAGSTSEGEPGPLAGIHVFSFGGFVESAKWIADACARSGGQIR